jgi:hypothetical protein
MTELERLIETDGDKVVNRDLDLDALGMESLEYVNKMGDWTGQWTLRFWFRYCLGEIKTPFRKRQYETNEDIIATVEGLGLHSDKFWWALLFIYDYVEGLFTDSHISKPTSIGKAIQELFAGLGDDFADGDIDLSIKKGKKSIEVLPVVKQSILDHLRELYAQYRDVKIRQYGVDLGETVNLESSSYRICVAVDMYRDLFDCILDGKPQKVTDKRVSLNKLLLISRICHLYKYSYNDNFLDSEDSLKGILKAYRGRVPRTTSLRYF